MLHDHSSGWQENLRHIRSRRVHFLRANASRTPFGRYDRVCHLANPASPDDDGRRPIATLLTNAEGTPGVNGVACRS